MTFVTRAEDELYLELLGNWTSNGVHSCNPKANIFFI